MAFPYDLAGAVAASSACLHLYGHTRASPFAEHAATILRIPDPDPAHVDTKASASGRAAEFRNR